MRKETKFRAVAACLAVVFSGVGTKYLPEISSSGTDSVDEVNDQTAERDVQKIERPSVGDLNMSGPLPYLSKKPILDGNLYIEQDYNKLVFGGANFEGVKFSARTREGDKAEILSLTPSFFAISAFGDPYIEFEYRQSFYALRVIGDIKSLEHIDLRYEISEIERPTMFLKSFREHQET